MRTIEICRLGVVTMMIAAASLATGCASETAQDAQDDVEDGVEPTGTTSEALSTNSCSAGSWNGYALKAWVSKQPNAHYLRFYFSGVPATIHNNATVTLHRSNGTSLVMHTADNIHDRVHSVRELLYSGAISSAVGPGDQMTVRMWFDLPGTGDKSCTTSITF